MARPARARIDIAAFRHNYYYAKSLAPTSRALAVIKANAYGHGAVRLAQALPEADGFGVACIEEALELRESGITQPVILLEGIFTPDELTIVDRQRFMMVVHTIEQVEWIEQALQPNRPFHVWLKLDTGMHRLGFAPNQAHTMYQRLKACEQVGDVTVMTHFARADEIGQETTLQQMKCFESTIVGIKAPLSVANSPATLAWPATRRDWVRPGIMLYGASPLDSIIAGVERLQSVMTLESALIAVRDVAAGDTVGYGARFRCSQNTRVGVVAMGYADGYPRHAIDGTPVLVNGVRTRLIGRVSMDMLTVDLTELPQAKVGDPVQLWGKDIAVNEIAAASQTIAYQLFTNISRRVPLCYINT